MYGTFEESKSKLAGNVSEVALMTPIKLGRIPGERRTYEEKLRQVLASIQGRAERGIPTPVSQVPSIHFARWLIIRPEHYLLYSNLAGVDYHSHGRGTETVKEKRLVPKPIDPYVITTNTSDDFGGAQKDDRRLRSWLMTLILFDGDVKVYGREIAEFIQDEVDRIFENCDDYPRARDFPKWWQWFRRHQLSVDVFYNACPDLSVARIKELERFKARFDAFVEQVRPHGKPPVDSIDHLFDQFVRENRMIASGFPNAGGIFVEKD